MRKPTLHLPHLHLTLTRLTNIVAWVAIGFSGLMAVLLVWYSLAQWYRPLQDTSIPEDKLTQKREQIRLKDFDDARSTLEAKQKATNDTTLNPFE